MQRESFEAQIMGMEEEVTQVSLGRYKTELDSKQKFLKTSQQYEEQLRDMRLCLAIVFKELEIGKEEIPLSFKDSNSNTPFINSKNDRIDYLISNNKDLSKLCSALNKRITELRTQALDTRNQVHSPLTRSMLKINS